MKVSRIQHVYQAHTYRSLKLVYNAQKTYAFYVLRPWNLSKNCTLSKTMIRHFPTFLPSGKGSTWHFAATRHLSECKKAAVFLHRYSTCFADTHLALGLFGVLQIVACPGWSTDAESDEKTSVIKIPFIISYCLLDICPGFCNYYACMTSISFSS